MGYVERQERMKQRAATPSAVPMRAAVENDVAKLHEKARRLIETGELEKALGLLNTHTASELLKNAKGVCLMRLGRFEPAVRLYRELVLKLGCTWMRPELPVVFKTNFCTALLLDAHPAGCAEALAEIKESDHPAVVRLRAALAKWKSELSIWQRILYACGLEPSHRANLDFAPGDLPEEPQASGNATA